MLLRLPDMLLTNGKTLKQYNVMDELRNQLKNHEIASSAFT